MQKKKLIIILSSVFAVILITLIAVLIATSGNKSKEVLKTKTKTKETDVSNYLTDIDYKTLMKARESKDDTFVVFFYEDELQSNVLQKSLKKYVKTTNEEIYRFNMDEYIDEYVPNYLEKNKDEVYKYVKKCLKTPISELEDLEDLGKVSTKDIDEEQEELDDEESTETSIAQAKEDSLNTTTSIDDEDEDRDESEESVIKTDDDDELAEQTPTKNEYYDKDTCTMRFQHELTNKRKADIYDKFNVKTSGSLSFVNKSFILGTLSDYIPANYPFLDSDDKEYVLTKSEKNLKKWFKELHKDYSNKKS